MSGRRPTVPWLPAPPPASGSVVMATGIVSIALVLDGQTAVSVGLLILCAAGWGVLALLVVVRAAGGGKGLRADARSPAALSAVAATAVLGARAAALGWRWAEAALLILALVLWAGLLGPVLSAWRTPTTGASLLLPVATESLAVLAATVAADSAHVRLLYVALVPLGGGLCLYVFVIVRFRFRGLVTELGEHWVTGGALAISTLAAAKVTTAADALGVLGGASGVLRAVTAVLWALSMAWLGPLVLAEVIRPRLRYDLGRWAMVFPLGMYAACSFVAGAALDDGAITAFARGWVWVALAAWAVVMLAMIGRGIAATARRR